MTAKRTLYAVLILGLLVGFTRNASEVSASPAGHSSAPAPARMESAGDAQAQGEPALPEGVSGDWWAQAQAYIQQSEYEITWQEGTSMPDLPAAYQAPNRAHAIRTYFASLGIRVIPREEENPSWQLGLSLLGFGPPGDLLVAGNRIDYPRAALLEWYLNDEHGLQQGFVIPPAASTDSENVLELEITGDLVPGLSADGLGIEFSTADGRTLLRYGDLQLSDSTGQVQPVQLELLSSGTLLRLAFPASQDALTLTARLTSRVDLVNAPDGLPGTFDWSAGPADQTSATFGWFVSTAGDVNGDGYGDVIIGAPHYDGNGADSGKVYVWYGGEEGLCDSSTPPDKTCAPEWEAVGEAADDRFGFSVAGAGDVNGDGLDDIIVGAWLAEDSLTNEGAAYVWHGGEGGGGGLGDPTIPNWKAFGKMDSTGFGHAVGTAGDVNRDGYSDIIIGGPYYDADDHGKVWVWYGSGSGLSAPGTPDWWAEGEHGGDYFGWSVSTAGDVGGDGFSDIIVGAYWYTSPEVHEGAAYIWLGGQGDDEDLGDEDRTADWKVESNQSSDFGRSVSTAGDVNGDGYSDIIVGASHFDNDQIDEGAAFVWYGSAVFFEDQYDTINDADWRVEGQQGSALLGYFVSTAGDVNGDGYSDVIVGAPWMDAGQGDEGVVFVWFGSSAGLGLAHRSADWSAESNQTSATLGFSVSTAGDVNGDGYSDVIVGAPHYDQAYADEGVCFVYHGSPGDPLLRLDWSAGPADQASATFGWFVSTAGDVNGDGYGDIIVGAPHYDGNGVNSGKVYVWYGGEAGLGDPTIPPWEAIGERVDDRLGYSVAGAGDVDGDGYGDIIVGAPGYDIGAEYDHGKVRVWYGAAGGLGDPLSPSWEAIGEHGYDLFGWSVSTAGDVNGDGCSEVIVGAQGYYTDDHGKVYAWYGAAGGLVAPGDPSTASWWADGEHGGDNFGWSVSTAGDVNGDGFSDILVGAYYYDNGQVNEGAAYIWHGGHGEDDDLGEPDRIPNWRAESNQYGTDFGRSVGTAGDVNGDGYSDVIVGASHYENGLLDEGAAFVWYGSAEGIGPIDDDITSADWMVEGEQTSAVLGYSVSTAGDVNGDGYSDVIVGAPWFDAGQGDEGGAFAWYGSAAGLGPKLDALSSADWRAESNQATPVEGNFGRSVSVAGDVNGDGYSDVIVGSPHYDQPEGDEGVVYLYLGSGQGLSGLADPALEGDQGGAQLGYSLDSAGDINGDGYADIIVGAPYYDSGFAGEGRVYVFQGSPTGLITSTAWIADGDQLEAFFGWSVGTAGDINGDGYSDIIVGAPYYDLGQVNEGAAFVWTSSSEGQGLGPDATAADADWSVEGDQLSANFGWSVSTAGDVNGDGFSEVIIGAPGYDKGQTNEGRAYLYHGLGSGLSTSPDWSAEGDQVEAGFGNAVATAGDINGDGFADVIVGADQYDNGQVNEGRAYVYYGSTGGLSSLPGWKAEGDQANARFGCALSTAGDVNGDGYADVLVGAYRYDHHPLMVDEGAAFVWHGSADGAGADGSPDNAAWMAAGKQENAQYGFSVDSAGDVDGDGFADIIIGAPYYDSGPLNDGRAFVYHGSQEGLSATARWSGEGGDIDGAQFGYAVSAAGDVNADGYADVIVGAPSFDHVDDIDPTVPDVGLVSLYTGNGLDSLNLRPRQLQPDGSPLAHLGVSASETEVQLSLLGRSPLGRDLVRMQWQIAPLGTPFTDTSVISGSTSNWTDTGTNGTLIAHTITGLEPGTQYHWRVRLIYHPGSRLGMPASRWIHVPWDGWQEQDFRTYAEPPEPPQQPMTFLPIINK